VVLTVGLDSILGGSGGCGAPAEVLVVEHDVGVVCKDYDGPGGVVDCQIECSIIAMIVFIVVVFCLISWLSQAVFSVPSNCS
jgi:hypothetical protein